MVPKSEKEKQLRKSKFQKMTTTEKIDYIFTYYKLPIFTVLIAATVLIISIVRIYNKKDSILYIGLANVAIGESLTKKITDDYLLETGRDPSKNECILYEGLYIAENPSAENNQYAYASKIKVLGSIAANKLNAIFMNQEAYDQMSRSGLLLDLENVLSTQDELNKTLGLSLVENAVILEDNVLAYELGNDKKYEEKTENFINAIQINNLPLFQQAGFNENVYLGLIANTENIDECLSYLSYLAK